MYERVRNLTGYFLDLRKSLDKMIESYNSAIGCLETRVLVTARKFKELGASSEGDIETLEPVDKTTRVLKSEELKSLAPLSSQPLAAIEQSRDDYEEFGSEFVAEDRDAATAKTSSEPEVIFGLDQLFATTDTDSSDASDDNSSNEQARLPEVDDLDFLMEYGVERGETKEAAIADAAELPELAADSGHADERAKTSKRPSWLDQSSQS